MGRYMPQKAKHSAGWRPPYRDEGLYRSKKGWQRHHLRGVIVLQCFWFYTHLVPANRRRRHRRRYWFGFCRKVGRKLAGNLEKKTGGF
ncbi:hypothetical protein HanIR_Chr15g0735991 [Helianthus annuus]|nr:hypothetical protein HanIR_Chr15g0735991 [Helianthus annuus]